MQSSAKVLV